MKKPNAPTVKDPIEEKIERRRRQILVHSYIYYELDRNIITDYQWTEWAFELWRLQKEYPEIAARTALAEDFANFDDPSSGHDLNYDQPWIRRVAERLLKGRNKI